MKLEQLSRQVIGSHYDVNRSFCSGIPLQELRFLGGKFSEFAMSDTYEFFHFFIHRPTGEKAT